MITPPKYVDLSKTTYLTPILVSVLKHKLTPALPSGESHQHQHCPLECLEVVLLVDIFNSLCAREKIYSDTCKDV